MIKSFKLFINETTVYRGAGVNKRDKYLTWYSADQEQAQSYANSREGSVQEYNIKINNVLDLVRDVYIISPMQIVGQAVKQKPANKKRIKDLVPAKDALISYFGKESRKASDYWATKEDRKAIAEFLSAFGFAGVTIEEDNIKTYGMVE